MRPRPPTISGASMISSLSRRARARRNTHAHRGWHDQRQPRQNFIFRQTLGDLCAPCTSGERVSLDVSCTPHFGPVAPDHGVPQTQQVSANAPGCPWPHAGFKQIIQRRSVCTRSPTPCMTCSRASGATHQAPHATQLASREGDRKGGSQESILHASLVSRAPQKSDSVLQNAKTRTRYPIPEQPGNRVCMGPHFMAKHKLRGRLTKSKPSSGLQDVGHKCHVRHERGTVSDASGPNAEAIHL